MHAAVSAVGVDRPGIVAAISRVLFEFGGNIEDSRMALLGGHFATMLITALPDDADLTALESALAQATKNLDLVLSVRPVAEAAPGHLEGRPYLLTVYGADRPGIVADVTGALAANNANITDLATHVTEDNVYVMLIEVTLPPKAKEETVEAAVRGAAAGVDIAFHPAEAETL